MGVFVTSVQFVVVKSKFCCNAKFVEGTIHERVRLPFVGAMFICGAGAACLVQIPPFHATATDLFPSADDATDCQTKWGALFEIHVLPESVEE